MLNIYNMDCLKAMQDMKDNQYDLAIVDPPYGLKEDGKKNHSRSKLASTTKFKPKKWDRRPPNIDYFIQLKRISKKCIIWGANHFINNIPNNNSSCWLVWNKQNGKTDFADCELAYTNFKTSVRMFSFRWQGMLQGNMKNKEKRIHPTQKPVQLYKWILQNYAKEGDTILDTHLGSGSIAVACHDMGFSLDGYELDTDYFNSACKRLKEHQRQLKLPIF